MIKERPILFSAPMARALMDGSKTQTRRILKGQPNGESDITVGTYHPTVIDRHGEEQPGPERYGAFSHDGEWGQSCKYGQPGARLWVRETWMPDAPRNGEWPDVAFYGCGMSPLSLIPECYRHPWHCLYRATYEGFELVGWKPSIHMPRWASRTTLEITGVRVEMLNDISEADAIAEGYPGYHAAKVSARVWYEDLWLAINGPGSWTANPWVWVIEFKRIKP